MKKIKLSVYITKEVEHMLKEISFNMSGGHSINIEKSVNLIIKKYHFSWMNENIRLEKEDQEHINNCIGCIECMDPKDLEELHKLS